MQSIKVPYEAPTPNINSYTKEDVHGHTVVKQCLDCKFAAFIGKSQDLDKATVIVNTTFDRNHKCPIF